MPSKKISACSCLLRHISHPTRLMILEELMAGMKCVNDMQELLAVRQPNVSQHLAVLRRSGLVAFHKDGVSRCYYLVKPAFVRALFRALRRKWPAVGPPKRGRARGKTTGMAGAAGRKCREVRGRRRTSKATGRA